jgi:putative transposase
MEVWELKVLITPRSFPETGKKIYRLFESLGIEIIDNRTGKTFTEDQMAEMCADVDGLLVGIDPVTRKVMDAAPRLKAISKYGAGVDNIDLDAAREKRIKVKLVISDAHEGLKAAVKKILTGSVWQRCRVHFMRNVLSHIPKNYQGMVSSIIRMIFAQNDQASAREQLRHVVDGLKNRFPKAMEILEEAEEDILAYMAFPREHWAQIHSTNPLERLNREIRRRTDVVCIFSNREAVIRLVGAMLMEQNDEWQVGRRYFSLESMAKLTPAKEFTLAPVALLHK